jgi:hypothetical protein
MKLITEFPTRWTITPLPDKPDFQTDLTALFNQTLHRYVREIQQAV